MCDDGGTAFVCNTGGLPVTLSTWKKDNLNVVNYDNMDQMNTLLDPHSPSYSSELTILGSVNLSSLTDCTLTCDIYSDWAMTDQSKVGRQRELLR